MFSDILPTGYECGVLNGKIAPGYTVAIVGAGPVGLASLLTAQLYSPAQIIVIDPDENPLAVALRFGATHVINNAKVVAQEEVMKLTFGKGVNTVIEAVGIPATFELCQFLVAAGGRIANVGVHGIPVTLHLETLWGNNINISTRLVDTVSTPVLMKMVQTDKIKARELITHRFRLFEIMKAYDVFEHAGREKALKVIMMA